MQNELRTLALVDTDADLAEVARALAGAGTYYLDTEFESARSGKTLSVVQVSSGSTIYLVDALRLRRLEPLGRVIGRGGVTWVLHAGLQDVELLTARLEIREVPRLFDTQIAWALQSPEASTSLAYLQFRLLGMRAMKPHQADDWMRRPLPQSQLAYAASDIEHLPALRDALATRLDELGRGDAVYEASRELLLPTRDSETTTLSLGSFRNAWQLDAAAQAALRFLIDDQNALTDSRGCLGTKTLLAIASRLPRRPGDLGRIKGVSDGWVRRHGARVVEGISRAVAEARSEDFEPIDPPAYATWEDIETDGFLAYARAMVSARACVAPELGFSGKIMRALRQAVAESPDRLGAARVLDGWRGDVLRPAYEALCREIAPARGADER